MRKLYENRDDPDKVGQIGDFLNIDNHTYTRLGLEERLDLEGQITDTDLLKTLKKAKNGTAPGLTGYMYILIL